MPLNEITPPHAPESGLKGYTAIILTFFIGIGVCFILYFTVGNLGKTKLRIEFEARASGYSNAVLHSLHEHLGISEFLKDYFNFSRDVSRDEFSSFAGSVLTRYPGVQAFSWNPLVSNRERSRYERRARKRGFPEFHFTERSDRGVLMPAAERREYVVVYYIEPLEKNRSALGFDIASNPERKQALENAFDKGKPFATAGITLIQETGKQFGTLILNPVYKTAKPLKTVEERRKNRKGLVVEVLRIADAMGAALGDFTCDDMHIYLYDATNEEKPRLLYRHPLSPPAPENAASLEQGLHMAAPFDFGGRKWKLLLTPSDLFHASQKSGADLLVLSAGLCLVFLLVSYLLGRQRHTMRIEAAVLREASTRAQLADSEALHRATVEKSSDAVFITDDHDRFTYISPNTAPIFAMTPDEIAATCGIFSLLGHNLFDPDELDRKGELSNIESTVIDPGGTERFLLINIKRVSIKSGTRLYNCRDITERKHSETALRNSRERFRKIFDSQLDAILVLSNDKPAVVQESNRAACDIFGYASHELAGSSINMLHLDDAHQKEFLRRLFAAVREKGHLSNFEFSMKRKNGTIFSGEHTVLEIKNDSGERTGWISMVRDLTEIKRTRSELRDSENRFKTLFENAPLSYQSLSEGGNFIEVNETWLSVLGYEKEEVLGKNFGDFLHPAWRDHFKTNFPRFKAIGEILGVEFEIRKKDGNYILVSFHGKIGRDPDGRFRQTHCVFRDITEQKRMEDERIVLEARLQQAQKMESIGTLAGGIAHDFNNILSPIVGYTEMALEDLPEESPLRESLDEVYAGALRARSLVKQILTFSRQDNGEIGLINIRPVVEEALKLIRSIIPASIEIRHAFEGDCGRIQADPTKIHQVVMNLATNAYHAMENTGGLITVSLAEVRLEEGAPLLPHMTPGPHACLTVADTGKGIAPENLAKIFDPFFTTKAPGKGTGMGLSAVHGIVREIGGNVEVSGEPGKGSVFKVFLPVTEGMPRPRGKAETAPLKRGNERVLLVDDEEAVARMVRQMLERLGYRVTAYTDSLEALSAFRAAPAAFDMVITDMTMPGMTGDLLGMAIRDINPDIPILLCTGFSERIDGERRQSMGIDGLLMKPIAHADLSEIVRKVLDDHKEAAPGGTP